MVGNEKDSWQEKRYHHHRSSVPDCTKFSVMCSWSYFHKLLPSLGRQGQSAPCNIIAHLCVCLSVRSINAWVANRSLNGGSTWRPVQSFSSGPGRPLPASLFRFTVRARELVHSLHCLLARAPISLVVVALSVPGGLNLFDCSLELQAGKSSVSKKSKLCPEKSDVFFLWKLQEWDILLKMVQT